MLKSLIYHTLYEACWKYLDRIRETMNETSENEIKSDFRLSLYENPDTLHHYKTY